MAKLDLEDEHVFVITMKVAAVRSLETNNVMLDEALDEAQAPVFGGETKKAHLVIEIEPDPEAAS